MNRVEEERERQWRLRRDAERAQSQKEFEERSKQWEKEREDRQAWLQTPDGKKWLAEERVREAAARARQEAASWQRDALLIGVPTRLVPSALEGDGVKETEALAHAREFVHSGDLNRGASIVLLGPASRGKTFAAAAVLRAAAGSGSRAFIHFPGLVGALLDPARRPTAFQAAKETRLVIFDEIGGGYVKPGGLIEPLFEEIVFWRHGEFRPTIFTSNMSLEEFRDHFSDRVIDRIREWGPVYVVGGASLREPYRPAQSVHRPGAT